jgi:hypothetical protein
MDFTTCVDLVRGITNSLGGYPYSIILNTADVYSVKIWTNDGAMLATCSRPDRMYLLNQSDYL